MQRLRIPLATTFSVFFSFVVTFSTCASEKHSPEKVAARIDEILRKEWKKAEVEPAPIISDATFLRRSYLDLTGAIPSVGEVREFLADDKPNKREKLIDRLIGEPGQPGNPRHASHLATIWRRAMLPGMSNNVFSLGRTAQLQRWLQARFADNVPYDEFTRNLLTASGEESRQGPSIYYSSLESKAEELATSTARIFLGVQLSCAQCHDHPFDKWKQKDFWGYAAFFAQLKGGRRQFFGSSQVEDLEKGEVKLPDSETVVAPKFLDTQKVSFETNETRRQRLARWVISKRNPYFAKAAVNRVWAVLFGYGIVDPVDDFGSHNPASQPEILKLLANDFVENGYNLRRLFRIVAKTKAYQLSSEFVSGHPDYPELFHRMPVKSLTAEQIFDCLAIATRKKDPVVITSGFGRRNQARLNFIAKFESSSQSPVEFQSGIPQALTMMNGKLVSQITDPKKSQLLSALVDSPFLNDEKRIEVIFLSTLSRFPDKSEREKYLAYVKAGGVKKDSAQALADVLWVLINSTEFLLNH